MVTSFEAFILVKMIAESLRVRQHVLSMTARKSKVVFQGLVVRYLQHQLHRSAPHRPVNLFHSAKQSVSHRRFKRSLRPNNGKKFLDLFSETVRLGQEIMVHFLQRHCADLSVRDLQTVDTADLCNKLGD